MAAGARAFDPAAMVAASRPTEPILTSHYHAVVWIDHREARVIHFNADEAEEQTVPAKHTSRHLHSSSGSPAGTHDRGDSDYFRSVADAVSDAGAFLVTGPAGAKTEFVTWIGAHVPQAAKRLAGVETLAQVSDKQLVAEARRFFKGADRMKPRT